MSVDPGLSDAIEKQARLVLETAAECWAYATNFAQDMESVAESANNLRRFAKELEELAS